MTAQTIFYIIIGILLFDFIVDKVLDYHKAPKKERGKRKKDLLQISSKIN